MNILDSIHSHEDLVALSKGQIPDLCNDIRDFLIESVSKTGGHLASSLGTVELTVALHRVFDPYQDRILFDVGHQAYTHKILTGRKEQFHTLRQFGGISAFPKPDESNADAFIAGHASDSISIAVGMSRARALNHENYSIISVVGDGSMTGGLCYEGLCDVGGSGEPIIVVLNDNGMSIAKSVGGISKMLQKARVRPGYIQFKKFYRRVFLKRFPRLYRFSHRIKQGIKKALLPPGIFDDLGFNYIGPINGHDEETIETTLRWAKELREPVLIHVVTVKGKGYSFAESDPEKYHSVESFDPSVGVISSDRPDYSSVFGNTAIELARITPSLCAVTAAMGSGTGLEQFSQVFPNRFFDMGIAEEHAVAMCGGMAKQGMVPIFAVYSTFLQRAFDMLIEDIGLLGLHVVFAVDRSGLVGRDGITHQGSFDLAYLSIIPGIIIYSPASYAELRSMLRMAVLKDHCPVAIRYPRGYEGEYTDDHSNEAVTIIKHGTDLTIVTYGDVLNNAIRASNSLDFCGISAEIVKINQIVPLETSVIISSLKKTGRLLMLEEACSSGSVGTSLLASCAAEGVSLQKVCRLDLGDGVVCQGDIETLFRQLGMDSEGIVSAAQGMVS